MLRDDLRQLDTSPRALRRFGLLVGGILAALAALAWWRGRAAWPWLGVPGALLLALGALAPRTLRIPHLAWMSLALLLGAIVGPLVLTVFFFLVITPVGLLARLLGKDFLNRRRRPDHSTYWTAPEHPVPRPPAEYERQF